MEQNNLQIQISQQQKQCDKNPQIGGRITRGIKLGDLSENALAKKA